MHTDSSFIFNSFRVGNAGCWWGRENGFFRFTIGIRNLRIHPLPVDEKMGFERSEKLADQKDLYGMSYSCLSFPINQSPIVGTSVLGRPRDH